MNVLVGWAIGIGCFLAYGAIGTAVALGMYRLYRRSGRDTPGDAAFLAGGLWPVGIWFLLGMYMIVKDEDAEAVRDAHDKERQQLLARAQYELDQL